jgi:tRNA threonylcarbamoyladenosine biosynthesis protein TsaB
VTQGLAFGAGVPVVPISDLRAVAQRAAQLGSNTAAPHLLVCNDARMHEVYWGCFERGPDGLVLPVGVERVSKPLDVLLPDEWRGTLVAGAGRGFRAYSELRGHLADHLTNIEADILPGARDIAALAGPELRAGRALPPEQALPVYLRDDVARPQPTSQ